MYSIKKKFIFWRKIIESVEIYKRGDGNMEKIKLYLKNKYILISMIAAGIIILGIVGIALMNGGSGVIIESVEKNSGTAAKTAEGAAGQEAKDVVKENSAAASNAPIGTIEPDKDQIKVYVVGCVNNPGLVTLKKGQLIGDAIDAAGGAAAEADIYNINLAYKLNDNAMIRVKPKNEVGQDTGAPRKQAHLRTSYMIPEAG
jgi:competence protein ComEA